MANSSETKITLKRKNLDIIVGLIPLVSFLLIWEFVISTKDSRVFLFSSPSIIFYTFIENVKNGVLPNDFLITGQEVLFGFILGNFVGATIGLSLWYSERIANLTRPYIIALGAVPIFSIAPMMIIWFGTGLYAKVMVVAISTVLIAMTQSYEGARQVDSQQIKLFQSFGASKNQIFSKLIIPSSLVWLFNSLKLNVSFAILGAFIGEFISAEEGLAYRILKAMGTYDVALVLSAVICFVLLAFVFYLAIYLLERTLMKWK